MNLSSNTANATSSTQVFFLMPREATWWTWLITACFLALGLAGFDAGFVGATLLSVLQAVSYWIRERRLAAFPVQLRIAYSLLLLACFLPHMEWLFWLPTVGTFALNIFGYCLLARCLSLLPWNRSDSITVDLVCRTFLSRPMIVDSTDNDASSGCAGGICSIAAQVRQKQRVAAFQPISH